MTFTTVTDRYSHDDITTYYATGVWRAETLFDILETQASQQPDKVFVTDNSASLSYQELRDSGLRLAASLRRLGVGRGDRVSVQLPNWTEFVQVVVALSRLGAIAIPIMPIYRNEEVGYILRDGGVRLAVTSEKFRNFDYLDMYTKLQADSPSLEKIIVVRGSSSDERDTVIPFESLLAATGPAPTADELGAGAGADDPFVIVYSSGTTSNPKGCLHTFNTFAGGSRLLGKGLGYRQSDVQFGPSPITHTTGFITSLLIPLIHGAASHLMDVWEPRAGLQQIGKFRCTVSVTATTFLQMLIDVYDPDQHDSSSLRIWVSAGAPIPGSFVERARDLLPNCQIESLYGRTENAVSTMCTVEDDPTRSITSDGSALPGSSIRIVDEAGHEVPRGQEGDIAFRGPSHMLEYINNPPETAALFTPDGYSRSGDLGVMDADGYVRVTGRLKDIVIRGGMNISVRQVEDLLTAHPAIGDVAVVGMPDERLGERLCGYLVLAAGHEPLTLEDVRAYLLGRGLAIQKVPERLEIVSRLPMTATGKVQKHVLRADIAEKLRAEKLGA
ncbi:MULTISPECIES: AMP-binding protein [Protofrankia]|uniref:O-succinylbenzoate--CoA ligase n=1 Tax=Candidatus Protofrankia datiscae TaxID=2716812 RepID=F8AXE9_9ACTN|nr:MULTISPECIES: AMP-binding protein [Protofrankia]AEH09429.1 o-succinylbenzoate--CoA ligase [Candidatus Protofrankia datiscae]